jgi:PPOX class probable F420-dependent enzyme
VIPPEVEEFLRENTRTFLLTLREDGSPTGHPMIGLWRSGALWFSTYRKSAKVRNVRREARVCCVVTSPDAGRAVALSGRAAVMPPGSEIPPEGEVRVAGAVPDAIAERSRERLRSGKRVLIRVTPGHAEFL